MPAKQSGTLYVQTGQVVQNGVPESKTIAKEQTEIQKETQKLENLAEESTILFEAQSVFPFQLFPDKIIVESDKLTIIKRNLLVKNVFPILFDNLNSIAVHRTFIFASISTEVTGYEENPGDITHLWPKDAAKVKRLVMGILHAKNQGVDVGKIPIEDLLSGLEGIGKTTGEIETSPLN
jgi:hypothetical protein